MELTTKTPSRPGWPSRKVFLRLPLRSGIRRRCRGAQKPADRETSARSNWKAPARCARSGFAVSSFSARPGDDVEPIGHADEDVSHRRQNARDVTLALQVFQEHEVARMDGVFLTA